MTADSVVMVQTVRAGYLCFSRTHRITNGLSASLEGRPASQHTLERQALEKIAVPLVDVAHVAGISIRALPRASHSCKWPERLPVCVASWAVHEKRRSLVVTGSRQENSTVWLTGRDGLRSQFALATSRF